MQGMEADVVKAFHNELVSLYELKPPISKNKIQEITKAAIRAIKYYKHVVFGVEKFLTKCKPEYKLPGMYCIDSIIRQSQHQYKEKDVFAARFAVNMLQTVVNLMSCKPEDTLKIVRVMNLWIVQKVYEENIVRPWLEYCRKVHGVDTDFLSVEKSVKGDAANLSLYNKVLSKGDRKSPQILSPILSENKERKEMMPHTPPFETNDEATDGGISEKETLEIITNMNLDLGGMFSQDLTLLKRLSRIINDKLTERREIDSRRQGNIKNLLSREFDYSDEEDSGDEDSKRLSAEAKPTELTKQQIRGMAETVLRDEGVKEEIQRMHTERLTAMSQTVSHYQTPSVQKPLQNVNGPVTIPLNSVEQEVNASLLAPLPTLPSPIRTPSLLGLPVQPPQMILPVSGNLPGFAPNILPPTFNIPPPQQHNVPMQNRMDTNRMDADQDDRIHGDDERYELDRGSRDHRDNRNRDRREDKRRSREERDRDRNDYHDYDTRPSKKSRRSRSREREDSRKDRRHTPSEERRSRSRGHDRDNENSTHREVERQKRKMGIPWPSKPGHLLIASCTLWFGRLPSNCSEKDIRMSVIEAGEPRRINVISSRACAYVTMKDRKAAFRVMERLQRGIQVAKRNVKLSWGIGQGLKEKYMDYWDSERGVSQIPYSKLPDDLEPLLEGGQLDLETLPSHLAGLYEDYSLMSKRSDTTNGSSQELQTSSNLSSLPFPAGQVPPVLGGTFFPSVTMPMPGTFTPGLPPPVGTLAQPSFAPNSNGSDVPLNDPQGEAESSSMSDQPFIPTSRFLGRPPLRAPSFNAGMPPFAPRGFPDPTSGRFVRAPGFRNGPCFRSGRFGFVPRSSDGNFRGRPRFSGQYPNMETPPRFFNPIPVGGRLSRPHFRPKEEGDHGTESVTALEQKENHQQKESDDAPFLHLHQDKDPMDTSVSSTTCEDENPVAVVEFNSARKSGTDSKMAVTQKEDDLLENPIIYDPDEDD